MLENCWSWIIIIISYFVEIYGIDPDSELKSYIFTITFFSKIGWKWINVSTNYLVEMYVSRFTHSDRRCYHRAGHQDIRLDLCGCKLHAIATWAHWLFCHTHADDWRRWDREEQVWSLVAARIHHNSSKGSKWCRISSRYYIHLHCT